MNLRLFLLILSLLGNLTAAAMWWRASTPSTEISAPPPTTSVAAATPVAAAPSTPTQAPWADIDRADLPTLIHSLREAGFPASVIRAVAQTRANADLQALKTRLGYPPETEVYWLKPEKPTKEQIDAIAAQQGAHARQIDELLRDVETDFPAQRDALVQKHGPYSAEKLVSLDRIERDYLEMRSSRMNDLRPGTVTPESQAAVAMLEQERLADIAATLGPEDYLDYRLRHTSLASNLRLGLSAVNVNETEFRTIFLAAETSIPESRAMEATFFGLMAQDRPEFAAPRAALLAQLQTSLPPDRFAEVQQLFDPATYRERMLVSRLNLPLGTAQQVHDLRVGLESIADIDRTTLDAEQQVELTARETALQNQLQTLLGPDGYAGYNAAFPIRPAVTGSLPRP